MSFKDTSCPSYARDAVYIFLASYIEYRFLDYNEFEETYRNTLYLEKSGWK